MDSSKNHLAPIKNKVQQIEIERHEIIISQNKSSAEVITAKLEMAHDLSDLLR